MNPDHCYKLVLAYDGTAFCGWERQAQGERTVREVLEEGLHRLTGIRVSVVGAGRTDSGVHAIGQVVSFHLNKEMEEVRLFRGLNSILPRDILVRSVVRVAKDFHARYSARCKTYFYQILEGPFDDPFRSCFSHRLRKLPAPDRIRKAASLLLGEKDFSALQASGSDQRSTRRRILSIKVRRGGDWVRIFFTGDGFLYRMVRNMVSLVMAQASGALTPGDVERILELGDRTQGPPTYPAKGLFLWRVCY